METLSLTSITTAPSFGGRVMRMLGRVVDADRQYRAARHLRDLPEHLLNDIGIDRATAETLSRSL
jgi:uncharacterized protein YjiS (DUF1127 family)